MWETKKKREGSGGKGLRRGLWGQRELRTKKRDRRGGKKEMGKLLK